ncbi:hypothetical protein DSLASN_46280 [Desulfoluna limicola]|uniref:Uncharacterized protein n=1 Tax=Desulfoluna limicola TaxID=2810562 RepID=A0ABN6F9U6_9BACT|nr:hypothetical protein DSLASN_46280 [Desulfoluna limicola]
MALRHLVAASYPWWAGNPLKHGNAGGAGITFRSPPSTQYIVLTPKNVINHCIFADNSDMVQYVSNGLWARQENLSPHAIFFEYVESDHV